MSKPVFGAIADDFTGAVELAAMLAAGGARASLLTDLSARPDNVDAVVVAVRSRVAPAQAALIQFGDALDALQSLGARQVFFKYCATFDSTDAGNIGNCADLLADRTQARSLLFCPAFPEVGVTVYTGHLFVRGTLVSDSPKRFDPLTPMTDPDLRRVLARQTARGVGLVPWSVIQSGAEAVRAHAEGRAGRGTPYLIADALTEADLRTLAEATWDWPAMTGGSSVAAYYPEIWRAQGLVGAEAYAPARGRSGPGAVLAGSVADQTLEQIAVFEQDRPVLRLDLLAEGDLAAQALDWAAKHLAQGPVCVTTATPHARTVEIQDKLGVLGAARRAEAILAEVGVGLAARGVERIVVAGGETSGAVVQALGVPELKVAPYQSPGMGLCSVEAPKPLSLCLKSGKLGGPDAFNEALSQMERPH